MFKSVDHIVIVVPELEAAIEHYSGVGFTVARGGKHSIGSHNALIAFADGAYIELIAFLADGTGHPWQNALEKNGGGFVDFCMVTDNLEGDVAAVRRAGAQISDPYAMTRDRPDGYRLSWELSVPAPPWNGRLPFLIRDQTPRDERVPHEREHRNGVRGIQQVTIAVEDPDSVGRVYTSVLGSPRTPLQRPELDAAGVEFAVGPHRIELLAPKSEASVIAKWIRVHGESPFEAKLIATGRAHEQIDPILLGRARLGIA
jgi:catechol 2,3-dioxygenase-like lactoylglutathione lyase family enzyme